MPVIGGNCASCGVPFTARYKAGFTPSKYCSRKCWLVVHNNRERNTKIARSSAIKRGDAQRGRGDGKSYTKRCGKHEHRLVMERKLGRKLLSTEIVHHRDGDIHNNAIDNLEVVTRSEHCRRHWTWVKVQPQPRQCDGCGKLFTPSKYQVFRLRSSRSGRLFCSVECYRLHASQT